MNTDLTLEAAAAAARGMEAAGAIRHLDLGDGMHSLALPVEEEITVGTEIVSTGEIAFMLFDGPDQIGQLNVDAWITDSEMVERASKWTAELITAIKEGC